ncbi:MAG: hypothetical protein CYPHOPRED_002342 [Cyphobasidiales sp. Tagirdzhanova-0007]|nr:MAG: hypothetical protein CYPHOPRED_002342 [Cyphobasidiales sp. Tagirdzhanova-0007]
MSQSQPLARPVTTLGGPKVLSSTPLNSSEARFVELNELKYRASNGTEAPVDAISVEFPAGLIDAGESPEEAALRELAEETGYGAEDAPETRGKVMEVSKVCADSPGMSTETTVLVRVKVELDGSQDGFPEPKQKLDEGEFIEKRVVPIESK